MKPLLIVNPASGGGKTGKVFGDLRGVIERRLGRVECVFTEAVGHAISIAREGAEAGHELVIAVGGDGTLNEVAEGLITSQKTAQLGLIAQGTGGDFRRTLGLEHRLDHYLDALTSGRVRPLDLGVARFAETERHFINILSAGMGGLVDRYVSASSKSFGGAAAYFSASVRALVNIRLGSLRVTFWQEGQEFSHDLSTYMIAVCNGRYFGSGMHIAPMANPCDGQLELVALGDVSKLSFLLNSNRVYKAAHMREKNTFHVSCDRVRIEHAPGKNKDPYLLDVDGEALGEVAVDISLKRAALELRA